MEAIKPLLQRGELEATLWRECMATPPLDLVVLEVDVYRQGKGLRSRLIDRFEERTGLTAMTRTTALTCSTVAQLAASGGIRERGVIPLELLARHQEVVEYIIDAVRNRGISLSLQGPF